MTPDESERMAEKAMFDKMAGLLDAVANALKGDPVHVARAKGYAGMMHSWHDLPILSQKLVQDLAAAQSWKEAVIDAAVVNWTLSSENATNPRQAIADLLAQVEREALDPAISQPAAKLHMRIQQLEDQLNKVHARLVAVTEKLAMTADALK